MYSGRIAPRSMKIESGSRSSSFAAFSSSTSSISASSSRSSSIFALSSRSFADLSSIFEPLPAFDPARFAFGFAVDDLADFFADLSSSSALSSDFAALSVFVELSVFADLSLAFAALSVFVELSVFADLSPALAALSVFVALSPAFTLSFSAKTSAMTALAAFPVASMASMRSFCLSVDMRLIPRRFAHSRKSLTVIAVNCVLSIALRSPSCVEYRILLRVICYKPISRRRQRCSQDFDFSPLSLSQTPFQLKHNRVTCR